MRRTINFDKRNSPRPPKFPRSVNHVEDTGCENSSVYNIGSSDDLISCLVGGVDIIMLIDSGSKYNLIDDTTWQLMKLRGATTKNERFETDKRFLAYGRVPLKLLTVFDAELEVKDNDKLLQASTTFYVIEKGQQPLLGKVTAKQIGVLQIGLPSSQKAVVYNIDTVKPFPKMRNIELTLPVDRTVPPVIQPLRRCPIPLIKEVELKIDELLKLDIIEKVVEPTSWVSPLVPIVKENGELRLCVDMRRPNQAIKRLNHPLPVFDDLLPQFSDAKYFTTLDIKQAFHQVELSEDCRDVTTFITNWGLFRYKRLPFGVNCAPELFQNLMESILAGCKNTVIFIDDVVIYGSTEKEHDGSLKHTLEVLKAYGIVLNDHKCQYKQNEIRFLGHKLSSNGVAPAEQKVKTILQFRSPNTKEELRSFLGLVTYVSRFIPNLATENHLLRGLIKSNTPFKWTNEHQSSFDRIKQLIGSAKNLGYFDPKDRTLLVTDASGVGLGAVLIQFKKNLPRIISYASKSLSDIEKTYPPIEKEALGIVWGIERFKMYLIGIEFELETDHRPLEVLFTPTSRPTARVERWLLRVQAFKFKVVYRRGSANLADILSRLGSHVQDEQWIEDTEIFIRRVMVKSISNLIEEEEISCFDYETEIIIRAVQNSAAIDIEEVIRATETDLELQNLKKSVMTDNWNGHSGQNDLKAYIPFKSEFSVANGLVMRGSKLIIPHSLRQRMLDLAHGGHPGQTMMKRRLRERCWWPGLDKSVVEMCEKCEGCRLVQIPDPPEPMIRRPLPDKPWIDVAMDFLGPMPTGEYVLVVIDYYSRYLELEIMTRITAQETIKRLKRIFRVWGPPRTITLDNAKQFVSSEFEEFCNSQGVHLNHISPYWPQANGEVERQNRSLLKRMKIANALYNDWKAELNDYLDLYNNTPHTITGKAPSELLQNRKLRSKLPQLDDLETIPPSSDFRDQDQEMKWLGKQREDAKRRARVSVLAPGDTVLMKNVCPKDKLATNFLQERFTITKRQGSNVTVKSNETGKTYDRNTSHLKRIDKSPSPDHQAVDSKLPVANPLADISPTDSSSDQQRSQHQRSPTPTPDEPETDRVIYQKSPLVLRRSSRVSKPRNCYSP
ncbi:uncharacterized protein K02A2.6-like [Uranotaenia lowii]|uniref:uncharacterized protein K02A2.6-like n=1 Tax=Uranotaenia lowii TaxID=190385 RepID=UPI00247905B4|nr:uncharacterized protein K02A2.6-like [Uranotaenia lowii]